MNGWMFFSSDKDDDFSRKDVHAVITDLLESPLSPSREEWHAYIPESRESLQGKTLGFFCGGAGLAALKNSPSAPYMPEFPMLELISDYTIMPACWSFKEVLKAVPVNDTGYIIQPMVHRYYKVITETGTFSVRPPYVRVHGSYSFFPPPYVLKEQLPTELP